MIRGIEPVRKHFVGEKFKAAIPIATTAVSNTLIEGIRGRSFDSSPVPFHDHANYGVRIPRGPVWIIDGGHDKTISYEHTTDSEWWSLNPNMNELDALISHASGVVKDSPARVVGSFYVTAGARGVTSTSAPPSVIGRINMAVYGYKLGEPDQPNAEVTIRFYNASNDKYTDVYCNSFTAIWIDIPPLEVVEGVNEIMIFSNGGTTDPLNYKAAVWVTTVIFTETAIHTRPLSAGSYVYNLEPRP